MLGFEQLALTIDGIFAVGRRLEAGDARSVERGIAENAVGGRERHIAQAVDAAAGDLRTLPVSVWRHRPEFLAIQSITERGNTDGRS